MELVRLGNALVGYDQPICPPVSLAIQSGERIAILGPNGSGKSTLLRTIMGTIPALGGQLDYPLGRRPSLGYVPQSHEAAAGFPLSTHDVVLMGRYAMLGVARRVRKEDHEATRRQIELVGLADQEHVLFRRLSGGQQQRALVARALVGQPELLVLDEPTSALDPAAEHALLELVDELAADRKTSVLFVTHQISAAAGFATQVLLINSRAGVVDFGPAAALLTSQNLSRLYGLPIEIAHEDDRALVWMAGGKRERPRQPS